MAVVNCLDVVMVWMLRIHVSILNSVYIHNLLPVYIFKVTITFVINIAN